VYRYLVEGTVRFVDLARARGAQVIVVDTTGWVEGDAAVAAKVHKIRWIDPRHVVALQHRGEVEPILDRLPRGIAVHRLAPSGHVRPRSRETRRRARAMRFRRYFAGARRHTLELARLPGSRLPVYLGRGVPQPGMLAEIPGSALRHLVVGLADRDGWLKAVGSVIEVEPASQSVTVVAPLRSLGGVGTLQWGMIRVAPSGDEEGRLE
jgi:polynucleotide 5'-kinase involved in rRNA processing